MIRFQWIRIFLIGFRHISLIFHLKGNAYRYIHRISVYPKPLMLRLEMMKFQMDPSCKLEFVMLLNRLIFKVFFSIIPI